MSNSSHVSRTFRRGQPARSAPSGQDLCEVDVVHLGAVQSAIAALPDFDVVARAAEVVGLLGNPTRLSILLALRPRRLGRAPELCVCDLAVVAHASKSMTSHQLRLLRTAGLVRQRRAGKLVYYRLQEGPLASLLEWATAIAHSHEEGRRRPQKRRPSEKRLRA